MKREFRLRRATDFSRVRQQGKTFAHPLLVLIALPNSDGELRIGIAAGRSIGNAVERNRAKRRLRAAVAPLIPRMSAGWDLLFLSRSAIRSAAFNEIQEGICTVLTRAGLLSAESNMNHD